MPRSRATTDPFQEVFDGAAAALMALGIPRIPAKIAIALLLSDTGRLTTLDLTQRLAVSPAGISSGVKFLSTAGLVHVGTICGARRHVYQLVNDPPWLATAPDRTAALSASPPRYARPAATPNQSRNSRSPRRPSTPASRPSETARPTTNR